MAQSSHTKMMGPLPSRSKMGMMGMGPVPMPSRSSRGSHSRQPQPSESSSGSSSSPSPVPSPKPPTKPEEGDYIIDWNNSYVCSLMNGAAINLTATADQIRSEITKIEADSSFITENLPGQHTHLLQLNKTKKDISDLLGKFTTLAALAKGVATAAAKRVPV